MDQLAYHKEEKTVKQEQICFSTGVSRRETTSLDSCRKPAASPQPVPRPGTSSRNPWHSPEMHLRTEKSVRSSTNKDTEEGTGVGEVSMLFEPVIKTYYGRLPPRKVSFLLCILEQNDVPIL